MNNKQGYVYLASGIFNADTNLYNGYLAQTLEAKGYKCFLPQRDGFEVANLAKITGYKPDFINEISHYIPYFLDLGHFMSRSIAVVANLDEPIDSGMTIEIAYAKIVGLPVIGVRTDLRSQFGNISDTIGINPFPVMQCDVYIKHPTPIGEYKDVINSLDNLFIDIQNHLKKLLQQKENKINEIATDPALVNLAKGAELLFSGIGSIDNIHTQENLQKIIDNFVHNRQSFFNPLLPLLVNLEQDNK
ncbi:MAG: nucleoside 2-deoxyribosyltransferase [Rickettsiaceae bacterium H1]|nr:nucleoside 2-deoxyribosyltransferase [Rickettsiaceae bacterium H1]